MDISGIHREKKKEICKSYSLLTTHLGLNGSFFVITAPLRKREELLVFPHAGDMELVWGRIHFCASTSKEI
jgi:hypothetical protein